MRKMIAVSEDTKKRLDKLIKEQGRTVDGMVKHMVKKEEKDNG